MDLFVPIVIVIVFFILFTICGWCCKKHREGTVYGHNVPQVSVAQQHVSASPVVQPPYPIDAMHPMPQQGPPISVYQTGYQAAAYPYAGVTDPYPLCPRATSVAGVTPYPPVSSGGGIAAPPPTYSEAVSQPPQQPPPMNEMYAKQAPYNPHY